MLIGLIIVLIGMTVAVPSFQGMVARNNVATEVNDMAINLARSEAERQGTGISVQAKAAVEGNEFGAGYCVVPSSQGNCDANVIQIFQRQMKMPLWISSMQVVRQPSSLVPAAGFRGLIT